MATTVTPAALLAKSYTARRAMPFFFLLFLGVLFFKSDNDDGGYERLQAVSSISRQRQAGIDDTECESAVCT